MKICLLGGSGFIGKALAKALLIRGDTVIILTRTRSREQKDFLYKSLTQEIALNNTQQCMIMTYSDSIYPKVGDVDVLINLAGAPIADHFWTSREKKLLINSRIKTTQNLLSAVSEKLIVPKLFISGSAIGYYGHRGITPLTEDMDAGDGFLAELAQLWEDTALSAASECQLSTAILRTGIVLGQGGFLNKIRSTKFMGIYTQFGQGNAYLPWIHIDDYINAVLYIIDMNLTGIFNMCSPNAIPMHHFMHALKRETHGLIVAKLPAQVAKYGLGELSQLFLFSQNAKPINLVENGFKFTYKNIEAALKHLLK